MKDNSIIITNIQRFSLHDGPGIRTTAFLKGCTLHCPWCCNPENISSLPQLYQKDGYISLYGENLSCDDLYEIVIKDKIFYGAFKSEHRDLTNHDLASLPGGVTFSGGEALLQFTKLEPLLNRLKNEHVHMAIETSLFAPPEQLRVALKYIDLFYVDIKILDDEKCKSILGGDLEVYLNNLNTLFLWRDNDHCGKSIIFRIPLIGGYTDSEINIRHVLKLIKKYSPMKVEIIKEHNLGNQKYISLGMQIPIYNGVDDKIVDNYKSEIEKIRIPVEICSV